MKFENRSPSGGRDKREAIKELDILKTERIHYNPDS